MTTDRTTPMVPGGYRKSSYSGNQGNCVYIDPKLTTVLDSKSGESLRLPALASFIASIKGNDLDS